MDELCGVLGNKALRNGGIFSKEYCIFFCGYEIVCDYRVEVQEEIRLTKTEKEGE